ncbi:MAG: 50S ribosomal protein L11 methyltransferase [Alphaproteobacteria bacterium]|nr:50S ribosomal protein L11 methyltransferase [Alphaproteobacteria bacterium]
MTAALDRNAADAFIAANTAPGHHPLVPEIGLSLASAITPIWHASEESLAAKGVEPPFWAFAWPGGTALARFLLDHPEQVRDKDVFDVAAGSAIAAIAAALSGAARVRAADIDALACAAMDRNADLNGAAIEVIGGDPLAAPPPAAGVILAGDVFYDRDMAARIEPWLRSASAQGAEVLVADPGRAYLPEEGLVEIARYAVPTVLDLEDREVRETVIYRLGR